MQNLFGLDAAETVNALAALNLPSYRAKQIRRWLYERGVTSFAMMTDLPKELRAALAAEFVIDRGDVKAELNSQDGLTTKFLLSFSDGEAVETVCMRHNYGHGICVSSQAGCNMGCAFCASTLNGLRRDLTVGEMMAQVVLVDNFLRVKNSSASRQLDNLVIMGSGEPLNNYANVLKFIRLLGDKTGLNFGYRRITLSTSGIVPRIYDLSKEKLPLNLSVSLHAPTDELRSRLMPVNNRYPLSELIPAADYYAKKTGRRVTYEYILIDGVNDRPTDAAALVKLIAAQCAAVNVIPINPVPERGFKRPSSKKANAFAAYLNSHHVPTTIRKEMGADIAAACGQLRNKFMGLSIL